MDGLASSVLLGWDEVETSRKSSSGIGVTDAYRARRVSPHLLCVGSGLYKIDIVLNISSVRDRKLYSRSLDKSDNEINWERTKQAGCGAPARKTPAEAKCLMGHSPISSRRTMMHSPLKLRRCPVSDVCLGSSSVRDT
eukprot:1159159-Pelagomonas_calceolata.AAC.3